MPLTSLLHRRLGALAATLALAAACGVAPPAAAQTGPAPGITDSTVRIGISGALSGPVAALGAVPMGIELRIKSVNAAGGIRMADGKTRKVELLIQDDALEPQRTMTNVRKLVEQEQVFALVGTTGTPGNQAIRAYVNGNRVPNLFVYSGQYEWGDEKANPWTIGLVPSFTTEAAIYVEHLKRSKPDAKIGLLYLNTDMGRDFQAGLKAGVAGTKLTLVSAQPTANTDPTVDTQLTALRESGADTLIVVAAPRQSAQAVKFAAESGWKPKTFVSYAGSSPAALKPGGLDNAKGVMTVQFLKPVDGPGAAADAGVKRYLADVETYKPRFDKGDTLGQIGYTLGDALVHALGTMKAPTREALMDAVRNMDAVKLDLLLPGIALSTRKGQDGFPVESLGLYEFDGAAYKPVGGIVSFEGKTPRQ